MAQLSTAVELLLGALAGGLAQIFTIPVSVIATRQQLGGPRSDEEDVVEKKQELASASSPAVPSTSAKAKSAAVNAGKSVAKVASPSDPDSFLGVAREILRDDGITGLWRGLKPSLVLTVNPAITYGVFEREFDTWED